MSINNKKKRPIAWKRVLFVYGGLAWPVLHFMFFWLYTNVGTVVYSFFGIDLNGELVWKGLYHYKDVFKYIFMGKTIGMVSLKSILNTFSMIFLALFINVPITLMFSYMIYKKIKGHAILRVGLYLPCVVSAVILCLFFRIMFSGTATYTSIFTILEKIGYKNQNIIQNGV
ncbi:MAG: sugar ABC transporter permease, partial [Clostridia bacterium]|nr:sugar ABC transporter permease [Clostridia bacterium]